RVFSGGIDTSDSRAAPPSLHRRRQNVGGTQSPAVGRSGSRARYRRPNCILGLAGEIREFGVTGKEARSQEPELPFLRFPFPILASGFFPPELPRLSKRLFLLCYARQQHEENGAAGRIIFHPNCAFMRFDDGTGNRQAEAKAFAKTFLSLLSLMKRMEDGFFMRVFDARTGIRNPDQCKS